MNFLITGGASGLGSFITRSTARKYPDAQIYFTYFSSNAEKESLEKEFENVHGIRCDFNKAEDVESVAALITDQQVDVLVNNALTGISMKHFHKTPEEEIIEAFRKDVLPVLHITKSFLAAARKKKSGKIITVLSAYLDKMPPSGLSVYVANKQYLLSMHRSWASENKIFGITSNCISPEFMLTPLNAEVDERVIEGMIAAHPLKKLLGPADVAEAVLFLYGASVHLNGQNIVINSAQS